MFSIVVCVIVGILVFLCGYLAGWNNCHSKIKVGTPSTSTNNARAKCTVCGKEDKLFCRRCASPIA